MNYLAHYRKTKRLTQYDIAKILGISDVMVSKFETGKRIPTNEQLVKLSEILEVNVKKLFPELFGNKD